MAPKLKPETLVERKAQILAAALTCFSRKGYHQTTMDDIVEEAGLSKGGLYWHFSSKKELFLALFDQLFATETDQLSKILAGHRGTAEERMLVALDLMVQMATADEMQQAMPLMIDVWAQNRQDPEVNEAAVELFGRFRKPIVDLIEGGISSGEFRPVDANALASILFGMYDGLAVQWMIDSSAVDWDVITETVKKTLLAGLLSVNKS
jgi:TetR/AcrR family transcriptional repressor of uid operon